VLQLWAASFVDHVYIVGCNCVLKNEYDDDDVGENGKKIPSVVCTVKKIP